MKKYELITDQFIEVLGVKLFRIKALVSFGAVKEGELGGHVQSEGNLSQCGNAWVCGDAQVYGDAWVWGDAQVSGDARVFGSAQVYGNAWVSGDAKVSGNAQVSGDARVTPKVITGMRYTITITDAHLRAGCQMLTFAEWRGKTEAELMDMDGRDALDFYPTLTGILDLFGL